MSLENSSLTTFSQTKALSRSKRTLMKRLQHLQDVKTKPCENQCYYHRNAAGGSEEVVKLSESSRSSQSDRFFDNSETKDGTEDSSITIIGSLLQCQQCWHPQRNFNY